ncbi:MAG: ComE operon protein 1 [Chloroflexi bacterium ADurb.Bin325]|nr:MAG: ComE operon protein 1 [Chloroflexi bacterium ADurb.Bin325]
MKTPDRVSSWLGYIGLSLVWLVVLAAVVFLGRRPSTKPIEILPPPTLTVAPLPSATPTPGLLRVDVAGAVRQPAVYRLAPGSLVADAIAAAGGPAADADLDRINKAILLEDHMQVYVPRRDAADAAAAPPPVSTAPLRLLGDAAPLATPAAGSRLIDLNTASLAELDSLPGIGEVTAKKIVAGRPYASVEELLRVDGIGPARLDALRPLVTVK